MDSKTEGEDEEEDDRQNKFNRYPNLGEEDIKKVERAFGKLFTPLFKGHCEYLTNKVLPSAGSYYIQGYTWEIINEVNDCVLDYVVSGNFQKPEYRNIEKAKIQKNKEK